MIPLRLPMRRLLSSLPPPSIPLLSSLSPSTITSLHTHLSPLLTSAPSNLPSSLSTLPSLLASLSSLHSSLSTLPPLLSSSDPELVELAQLEEESLLTSLNETHLKLLSILLHFHHPPPTSPHSAILELRPGTGGEEAALFVQDLHEMYVKMAGRKGWKVKEDLRGKEVVLHIRGKYAAQIMKSESGVHRVQRVPLTETQGRIHTSTASVAVLGEEEEYEQQISDADVRIDVYRASGAGGQHVNKTESAVRITHLKTGVVVTCQQERSQRRNKAKAMEMLKQKVSEQNRQQTKDKRVEQRRGQLGQVAGERSDKIRTYNFKEKRVTDHRLIVTNHINQFIQDAHQLIGPKSVSLDAVLAGAHQLDDLMHRVNQINQLTALCDLVQLAQNGLTLPQLIHPPSKSPTTNTSKTRHDVAALLKRAKS